MTTPSRLARTQARFVYAHAGWIVLAIVLISLAAFPFARHLKLKANLLDLLPANMPSVARLNQLTELVGGASFLVAVIESTDGETARQAAERFSKQIETFEDVDYVDNRTNLSAFKDRKLLFLSFDSLQKLDGNIREIISYYRRKYNPFFIDLLNEAPPALDVQSLKLEEKVYAIGGFAAKEQNSFMHVVLIKPNYPVSDFEHSARLFETAKSAFYKIQQELPEHLVTLGFTGSYKTRYDEYQVIVSDLKRTGFLTVILITLLIVIFFRNFKSVMLAFLPLSVGIFWTCAFAQLAIGYLNLISAFLLGILFGLGIDFAIHFLVNFAEWRNEMNDTPQALERTFATIGGPSLTSALTTSIAFLSLTISQFQGFRHFGLIAGVGILLCFLAIFYGLPSFLVICQKTCQDKWSSPGFLKVGWPKTRPGPIYGLLIAGIVFSGFSVTRIPHIQFDYNFENIQEKGAESITLAQRVGEHFGVVLNPVALVTPNRSRAVDLSQRINRYIETRPETAFDFSASLLSYIPKLQDEKIRLMRQMDELLEHHARLTEKLDQELRDQIAELRHQFQATPLTAEDLPNELQGQYEGEEGKVSVVYVYPKSSLLDGQLAQRFVKELRSLNLPEGVTIAGEPVVYADILMLLEQDTPRAMLISFGVVVLLLFFHFRRLKHVLWVLAPVMIGFLWLIGMASLAKFKFNYMNVTILPSILGVGIDNGIYIFHRYKKERKSTLFDIMRTTGKAVILASMTTMAAFASLFLARHRGMASMGEVGFLGFASCLLTSVLFIPALIEFLEMKYWAHFRNAKEQPALVTQRADLLEMSPQANPIRSVEHNKQDE